MWSETLLCRSTPCSPVFLPTPRCARCWQTLPRPTWKFASPPTGSLNRYVNVYLNDEDVRVLGGLDTSVGESDVLVILPAMAGGRV